jgi:hypothetical protein
MLVVFYAYQFIKFGAGNLDTCGSWSDSSSDNSKKAVLQLEKQSGQGAPAGI